MAKNILGQHIVEAPVSMTQGIRGRAEYTIVLCNACDQQVERSMINDRFECPEHGFITGVRFGVVASCALALGDPIFRADGDVEVEG